LKIDPASLSSRSQLWSAGISPGIFPYLGGDTEIGLLRSIVSVCGGAIAPGKNGAKLATQVPGTLIDPAAYFPAKKDELGGLFDYDDWLIRQREAGVPLILTDTPRIRNKDRSALRKALARWDWIDEPTLVVLPIEAWWLRDGLAGLIEEVKAAGRPVAVVLLHHYNGLDITRAVTGLLEFISGVDPVPVVLLRCDISAIGAVAHQALAGFVGWSGNTRHGPLPIRRSEDDDERDQSPSVLVPALHDYSKASALPAFAHVRRLDVLRCDDFICRGTSLLRIAELAEDNLRAGRLLAGRHNVASTEQLARHVFSAAEPRDAWWEACQAGAQMIASLAGSGVSVAVRPWLRQWLELGSPSHDFQVAG
jgi:hypothetical protein